MFVVSGFVLWCIEHLVSDVVWQLQLGVQVSTSRAQNQTMDDYDYVEYVSARPEHHR